MAAAFGRGCEASLIELAELFQLPLDEHPFETSKNVELRLEEFGLILVPALPKGNFDSVRLVCCATSDFSKDDALNDFSRGEGATTEFKSSLVYDIDRAASGNFQGDRDLRSELVIDSALKTVAAFLNSSGGVLYVGVDDNGNPVGIERDYIFSGSTSGVDGWELFFRDLIKGRFVDGTTVNNFVRFSFMSFDGMTVARVEIASRQGVSYFRKSGQRSPDVFVRQGNRTVNLTMPEFEEFLTTRLVRM